MEGSEPRRASRRPHPQRAPMAPLAIATHEQTDTTLASVVFDLRDVDLYYGATLAVSGLNMQMHKNIITAMIGPSGCGKSTVVRSLNRMNDSIAGFRVDRRGALPRTRHLRQRRRPGRGAPADRHGLPATQPVPQVDLRQHRLGAADPRAEGEPRRARREGAARGRALGRGQGPPEGLRARALRRPAAAPVHRPRDRDRARRAAARRAVLGARPDRHRLGRGADAGPQERLHARDRHAQHAAGRARRRADGVLQPRCERRQAHRRPGRVRRHREALHPPVGPAHRGLRHRAASDERCGQAGAQEPAAPSRTCARTSTRSSRRSRCRRSAGSTSWSSSSTARSRRSRTRTPRSRGW